MSTVGEFLAKQLESAGIDISGEDVKPLLSISIVMPEGVNDKINAALIPIAAAKSHKDIKNDIIVQFLKGADQTLNRKLEGIGLSKDEIDEIYKSEGGKNFSGRIEMALDKIDSMGKEALKSSGKKPSEEIEAFKKQVESLQGELSKTKKDKDDEIFSLKNTFETEKLNDEISREFIGKKWSDNFAPDLRLDIARVALARKLESEGAKVVRDGSGKLKLVPSDNPEGEYFDKSHKKVSFTELADSIMSENKFSAVTPSAGQQNANPPAGTARATPSASKNPTSKLLEQSLSDQIKNS